MWGGDDAQMVAANGVRLGLFRGFVITGWRDVPGYVRQAMSMWWLW